MENNFGAPRGVRAWTGRWQQAPSCQKRRGEAGRGGCKRRGKGANFIPTPANRRVAFLFGHSPLSVPFDQLLLLNRRGRGRPSCFHLLLSSISVPAVAVPAPLTPVRPRPPRAAAGEKAKEAEESPGNRNSGREGAGRKGKKLREAGRKKFLVAACFMPAQTLACGEGFLPLDLVWAAGLRLETEGDCRLRGRPRGRPVTSVGDTQPTRFALPRRRENGGCRLRAHMPAAEGHFLNAGKTHSLAARGEGRGKGGEFNLLSKGRFLPKTSPRCADLS